MCRAAGAVGASSRDGQVQRALAAASVDGERAEPRHVVHADAIGEPLREFDKCLRDRRTWRGLYDGRARVPPPADARVDGDLTEQRSVGELADLLAAPRAE